MLERAMGRGAKSLSAAIEGDITTVNVEYADGRTARVDLNSNDWTYKGTLYGKGDEASFVVNAGAIYLPELRKITDFFKGAPAPVSFEDSLEVMALLDAADEAATTGKTVEIAKF
jgi:predicted dehydrogenase